MDRRNRSGAQTSRVLNGEYPFDDSDMLDEDAHPVAPEPQMSTARPEVTCWHLVDRTPSSRRGSDVQMERIAR
jgi:hypothetical protein